MIHGQDPTPTPISIHQTLRVVSDLAIARPVLILPDLLDDSPAPLTDFTLIEVAASVPPTLYHLTDFG